MAGRYKGEGAADPLSLAMLVALAVHAGVILGIGFSLPAHEAPAAALEITLAPFPSNTPDERPDFLAAANQRGSGEAAERLEPRAVLAPSRPAQAAEPVPHEATPSPPRPAAIDAAVTATHSSRTLELGREQSQPAATPASGSARAEPTPTTEIASLMARLDEQARAYARRPRVQRMTSASTRATEDAAYLLAWTERIESVGNRNYPPEARSRRIYGDLRLLVAVRANGGVADIRVLQSSGYPVLDSAAIRIVRLSAPFAPFPPELRKRHDLIEIIRTWQFRANRLRAGE